MVTYDKGSDSNCIMVGSNRVWGKTNTKAIKLMFCCPYGSYIQTYKHWAGLHTAAAATAAAVNDNPQLFFYFCVLDSGFYVMMSTHDGASPSRPFIANNTKLDQQ